MNHLSEARLQICRSQELADQAAAQLSALVGIGHALIAIAEQLPRPIEIETEARPNIAKDLSAYLDGGADEQREKTACTRE